MEGIKRKILVIFLIVMALVLGYQAYAIAEGSKKEPIIGEACGTIFNKPKDVHIPHSITGSDGIDYTLFCRELKNSWIFGPGHSRQELDYFCVSEYNAEENGAYGLAYFISRSSEREIQDWIWANSAKSAGGTIMNPLDTDFVGLFGDFSAFINGNVLENPDMPNSEQFNELFKNNYSDALKEAWNDPTINIVDTSDYEFFSDSEEDDGLVHDLTYEEYSYLYQVVSLFEYMNGNSTASINANDLMNYVKNNLSDGTGTVAKSATENQGCIINAEEDKLTINKDVTIENANGTEIHIWECTKDDSQITYWAFDGDKFKDPATNKTTDTYNVIYKLDGWYVDGDHFKEDNKNLSNVTKFDKDLLNLEESREETAYLENLCNVYNNDNSAIDSYKQQLKNKGYTNLYNLLNSLSNDKKVSEAFKNKFEEVREKLYTIATTERTDEDFDVSTLIKLDLDTETCEFNGRNTMDNARMYQYFKQSGIFEQLVNNFRIDNSNARVTIDTVNEKYIIGPFEASYPTIKLGGETILGLDQDSENGGFYVKLKINGEEGFKILEQGKGTDQYDFIFEKSDGSDYIEIEKKNSEGKTIKVKVPKSGRKFYITLDKDIKGENQFLTASDQILFGVDYKYLKGIDVKLHFLHAKDKNGNIDKVEDDPSTPDINEALEDDRTWNEAHPQRFIAISNESKEEWGTLNDEQPASFELYNFRILKLDKETRKPLEGVKFAVLAEYKDEDGNTILLDANREVDQYLSLDEMPENKWYMTDSSGYIKIENVPKLISRNEKEYTLQKIIAKEKEALDNYLLDETQFDMIPSDEMKTVERINQSTSDHYTITIRKVNENGDPIKNLEFKYWYLDLTIDNPPVYSMDKWGKYSIGQFPLSATTDEHGIATFESEVISDKIALMIQEKKTDEYQYFKRIVIIYKAEIDQNRQVKITFLNSKDIDGFNGFADIQPGRDFNNGVYNIRLKDGTDLFGTEVGDRVKTGADAGADIDILIKNNEIKPYSLNIKKVDEFGNISTYLKGTKFKVYIEDQSGNEISNEIEVGEDGYARLNNLKKYGNGMKLYLQEIPVNGFKTTTLKDKKLILTYNADELGNISYELAEDAYDILDPDKKLKENERVSVSGEGTAQISLNLAITNQSDDYYLKFRKTDEKGNPLQGAEFVLKDEQGNKQAQKSDDNGYMKFIAPRASADGKDVITLELYESSARPGYTMTSDVTEDSPLKIEYVYIPGSNQLANLKITKADGKVIVNNKSLEGKQEDVADEKGNTVQQTVYNFGDLNDIFTLVNTSRPYDLSFYKEDKDGNPINDIKFKVSIFSKSVEDINNIPEDAYARYKDGDQTKAIKDIELKSGADEQDGLVKLSNVLDYGEYYVKIKELEDSNNTYEVLEDTLIFSYSMKPADELKAQETLIVLDKDGNRKDYKRTDSATAFQDEKGQVYEYVKVENGVKLVLINNPKPYKIVIDKVNGLSGKAISGVPFTAYISNNDNGHQYVTGTTNENGQLVIEGIHIYSTKEEPEITVNISETVPEGYRGSNYGNIWFLVRYTKNNLDDPIKNVKCNYIWGDNVDKDGKYVDCEIISDGDVIKVSENDANDTINIKVPNMPLYDMPTFYKVMWLNGELVPVKAEFTAKVKDSSGNVLKDHDGNEIKFACEVNPDTGLITAKNIDTADLFIDKDGKVTTEVKGLQLVLTEKTSSTFNKLADITIVYDCKYDANNNTFTATPKQYKYGNQTADATNKEGTKNLIGDVLIQIEGKTYLINTLVDRQKVEIPLIKVDEKGNPVKDIKFSGKIEQLDADGKTVKTQEFGTDGKVVTNDDGVATITGIDMGGNIKITISEAWKENAQNKEPLEFKKVTIEGIRIKEEWKDTTLYRTLDFSGIDKEKLEEQNVFFSEDENVPRIKIVNNFKKYDLDLFQKVEENVLGNTQPITDTSKITFSGYVTDSEGNVLQDSVDIHFVQSTENNKTTNSIIASGINGDIKAADEKTQFKLVITETNPGYTDIAPITVLYTCTYDAKTEKFNINKTGYEYKGKTYGLTSKDNKDIILGVIDKDGNLININPTYIPLKKYDEKGNPVNGIKFKVKVEQQDVKNPISKEYTVITGGTYIDANGNEITAPDGEARIPIDKEFIGKIKVTIVSEEWVDGFGPKVGENALEFISKAITISDLEVVEESVKYSNAKVAEGEFADRIKVTTENGIGFINFTNNDLLYDLDLLVKEIETADGNKVALSEDQLKEMEPNFTAKVMDSDDSKILQDNIKVELKMVSDKDNKTKVQIIAKDIKGSIIGDELHLILHETEANGLKAIPDITVVYKCQSENGKLNPKKSEYRVKLNGKVVTLKADATDTATATELASIIYKNENGDLALINESKTAKLAIRKRDSKGRDIDGIEFKIKVEPVDSSTMQEAQTFTVVTGRTINKDGKDVEGISGLATIENVKLTGNIKVTIESEKWAKDHEPKLGEEQLQFIKGPVVINGLEIKPTDMAQQENEVIYTSATVSNANQVTVNKDATMEIVVTNEIADYDLDIFDAKLLAYGESYEAIKDGVTFKAEIKKDGEVVQTIDTALSEDGTSGVGIDQATGKIVARGIKGTIVGDNLELVLTETSTTYNTEPMPPITLVYSSEYNEADGKFTTTRKEYKYTDANKKEVSWKADSKDKQEVLGGLIYANYSDTAKNSLINRVTPEPVKLPILKLDSNNNPVPGIKFTGKIVKASDANTSLPFEVTTGSDGYAYIELDKDNVNKFAGDIKVIIDKEEWTDGVKAENRIPLDFISGSIEISGIKLTVDKNGHSEIVYNTLSADDTHKDILVTDFNGVKLLGIKNKIKNYDLTVFDKKVLRVNNKDLELKDGLGFTAEIKDKDGKTLQDNVTVAFGEETAGKIIAKNINGNKAIGNGLKLILHETPREGIEPVDIIVEYNCTYNNGEFNAIIVKYVNDANKNGVQDEGETEYKLDGKDDEVYLDKVIYEKDSSKILVNTPKRDDLSITFRKVDEAGNAIKGIKFTGKVIDADDEKTSINFTSEATDDNGLTTVKISAADATKLLGNVKVFIEKEEWAEGAKAAWQAKTGITNGDVQFVSNVTIPALISEEWNGNIAHRSIAYTSTADNANVTTDGTLVEIVVKNNTITYEIPLIKTTELLENNAEANRLANVHFDITIKNGENDEKPQQFLDVVTNENGELTLGGITKFGDNVILTLTETSSESSNTTMLEDSVTVKYSAIIDENKAVKITFAEVTPSNAKDKDKVKPLADKIGINVENPIDYAITLNKKIKVDDIITDSNEEVTFKGIVTTNPKLAYKDDSTIKSYDEFNSYLDSLKGTDNDEIRYFEGSTNKAKLEISGLNFDGTVYVYFIETEVPSTMVKFEEVMWTSFTRDNSTTSVQGVSHKDRVVADPTDKLNIGVTAINDVASYKVNLIKVDAEDNKKLDKLNNAIFKVDLKEFSEDGLTVNSMDSATIAFDKNGKIDKEKSLIGTKYIVGMNLVNGYIQLDINKFGKLQLVITEQQAPDNYEKLESDIVVNYTAEPQPKTIKDATVESAYATTIDIKNENDVLSLDITIPNNPKPYDITIYKKIENSNDVANNITFNVKFYDANMNRIMPEQPVTNTVVDGKFTIEDIDTFGEYYMAIEEFSGNDDIVLLKGIHVFKLNARKDTQLTLKDSITYMGTGEISENDKLNIIGNKDMAKYFDTFDEKGIIGRLEITNVPTPDYYIDLIKVDTEQNPLANAEFSIYLTDISESYELNPTNLLSTSQYFTDNSGKIMTEKVKFKGEHKLTIVETNPPKGMEKTFDKIEIIYSTEDCKKITIKDVTVTIGGKTLADSGSVVQIDDKALGEGHISLKIENTDKPSVPLGIIKGYYDEEGNAHYLKDATFSGTIIEKETGHEYTFENKTTNENGYVYLGEYKITGEVEIKINEISAPGLVETIPETSIYVNVSEGGIINLESYSCSTNVLEGIAEKKDMTDSEGNQFAGYVLLIDDQKKIQTTITLGGFVWEERMVTSKGADHYVNSGLYDEHGYVDIEGNKVEVGDVPVEGIKVNLYKADGTYVQSVLTNEAGVYTFEGVDTDNDGKPDGLNPFDKYYITFTLDGSVRSSVTGDSYNDINYENVKFLVKSVKDDGTIEQYGSIGEAIEDEDTWAINSKAVITSSDEKGNAEATTTQKEDSKSDRQLYPYWDYFTIDNSDSSIVLYYNRTNDEYYIEPPTSGDYATVEFKQLSPTHSQINLGLVAKPKFDLMLQKDVDYIKIALNTGADQKYNYDLKENVQYGEDLPSMYTLRINQSDINSISDMEIVYKIKVTNENLVPGTLISIADYYNKNLLEFVDYSFDGTTWGENDKNKAEIIENNIPQMIPDQYYHSGGTVTKTPADTARVLIPIDKEIGTTTSRDIYVYVKYKAKNLVDKLKDGSFNVGDEYVTLGLAEIYASKSDNGRPDIDSFAGNLVNKFNDPYNKNMATFYNNAGDMEYYRELNKGETAMPYAGKVDLDDEDAAPAAKIIVGNPEERTISGNVFEDTNLNGTHDEDAPIQGIKAELVDITNPDDLKVVKSADTDANGNYTFTSMPAGNYIVVFTYGNENTVVPKLYTVDGDGNKTVTNEDSVAIPDISGGTFTQYPRYNAKSYNGLEFESADYDDGKHQGEYWYLDSEKNSDAYDVDGNAETPGTRKYADGMLNDGGAIMNNKKAEELYSYYGDTNKQEVKDYIKKLAEHFVTAQTPEFKVPVTSATATELQYQASGSEGIYKDSDGNVVNVGGMLVEGIDFGLKARPQSNVTVDKQVQNVKIYTSAGNVDVDASWDEGNKKPTGTASKVQWTKENNGSRGYIWIQRSEEEIIGATLEITYKITVTNNAGESIKVTLADYVQNGMSYAEANNEGKGWTLAKAETLKDADKITSSKVGTVAISDMIDLTNVSTVLTQDVEVGAGESKDIEVTLTKTLNAYSDTDIDEYTNYVEVIQTEAPELARKDSDSIPGNFDPILEETVEGHLGKVVTNAPAISKVDDRIHLEKDTAKSLESISITAETGDNRETTYYIITFAAIALLATGVGIIIKKVIKK